jgi:hypothetical protein
LKKQGGLEHRIMTTHRLSFASVTILAADLAEVVVDHGVEMTAPMVDEYHEFLCTHLRAPFSLLVNKLNDYSYDFAAQRKLAAIPEIDRMAVIAYKSTTENVTHLMTRIPRERQWHLKIFSGREAALAWLGGKSAVGAR